MAKTNISVIQTAFTDNREANIEHATALVEKAAKSGGEVILLPELFETHYFPRVKDKSFFSLARSAKDNSTITHFQKVAKALNVILPISFFEKDADQFFNTIAMIDDTGNIMGFYRKTFIPSGPGYEEKFYFAPGNTGFKVWKTRFGNIGVGICWDQWFPEVARGMTAMGADVLLYPTCIGSEPEPPHLDTKDLWQRAMIGHCVSNVIPVAAANRVGTEGGQTYYGSSFIADHRGNFLKVANRTEEIILTATLNFEQIVNDRKDFGLLLDYSNWKR